jgi:hypothetical protein
MRVPNTNNFSFKELSEMNDRVTSFIQKILNKNGVGDCNVEMRWVLGDFLEVKIDDGDPIFFCVGFRSLIDFEVEYSRFSRERMRDFLQDYLTGFPDWGIFFSKKEQGKFESVDDWAKSNGIDNLHEYVLTKELADDLLNNFYINNVGQLKKKILDVGVSGYNSLVNYVFLNKPYVRDTWVLDGLEFDMYILFRDETEATLMADFA